MKYLFDASAIFRAIKENRIEALVGNCTLDLARYELGNVLWKSFTVQEKAGEQEVKALAKIVKQTIDTMEVLQINCSEEETLNAAANFKITFYDASYAYLARTKNLTLVTEDLQLLGKIAAYVKASTLSETA